MKAPGVRAKTIGTKLKRGAAVQIVCYPRPVTKAALVKASWKARQPLSSFMILASLEKAAILSKRKVTQLVPQAELRRYLYER